MIKHVVSWNFPSDGKQENMNRIKNLLEALPKQIPEIKSYEVGINIKVADNANDMILVSEFVDQAALARYAIHPDHQRVVAEIRKVVIDSSVVDYEIGLKARQNK